MRLTKVIRVSACAKAVGLNLSDDLSYETAKGLKEIKRDAAAMLPATATQVIWRHGPELVGSGSIVARVEFR